MYMYAVFSCHELRYRVLLPSDVRMLSVAKPSGRLPVQGPVLAQPAGHGRHPHQRDGAQGEAAKGTYGRHRNLGSRENVKKIEGGTCQMSDVCFGDLG